MDKLILKRFIYGTTFVGWGFYMVTGVLEWSKKDEFESSIEPLSDEYMDNLVDILSEANISKKRKFQTNFVLSKEDVDFTHVGKFGISDKFVALPKHFSLKEDNEFDQFIDKLKQKYTEVDFSNAKNLLKLTPEEMKFAILFELHKLSYDLKIIDSTLIFFLGIFAINIVARVKDPIQKLSLATVIFLLFVGAFFSFKQQLLQEYATDKLKNLEDLELLEAGLKYLNKKIQLDQLVGKDVKILKSNLKTLEEKCKSLKETDASVDKNPNAKLDSNVDKRKEEVKKYMKHLKKEESAKI